MATQLCIINVIIKEIKEFLSIKYKEVLEWCEYFIKYTKIL